MPKVTLRIPLYPDSPKKLVALMQKVIEHHETLGASSPLNSPGFIDMTDFKQKVEEAATLRAEADELYREYYAKMGQARTLLGINKGQTISTEGTLYYQLDSIKKLLLVKHKDMPEHLEVYGFDVVVRTASVGRPKKKK